MLTVCLSVYYNHLPKVEYFDVFEPSDIDVKLSDLNTTRISTFRQNIEVLHDLVTTDTLDGRNIKICLHEINVLYIWVILIQLHIICSLVNQVTCHL